MTNTPHFTVDQVLRESWTITKRAWPKYLLLFLAGVVALIGFEVVYTLLVRLINFGEAFYVPWAVHMALNIMITAYLAIVAARTALLIAKNKPIDVNEILKVDQRTYGNALLGSVLYSIVRTIGFFLLIIPGIIASVMFPFYIYSIIDKGTSAVQSLEDSMRMTNGNKLTIFMTYLMLGILSGIAVFVPVMMALGGVVIVQGEGGLEDLSARVWLVAGILVFLMALVVGVIAVMMNMSATAYMYVKMRQHTPVNAK